MNTTSKHFWEEYYAKHRNPGPPSFFAQFVSPFMKKGDKLVEIGCGNGRDSTHFAENEVEVTAVDQCQNEVDYLNEKFAGLTNLNFVAGDMAELGDLGPLDKIYSRFSLHSVPMEVEKKVFKWAASQLKPGGMFLIEVRTINDELCGQGTKVGENEYSTDHYRRFIVPTEMEANAEAAGFRVLYSLESQGLAPFKDQDPAVLRLILLR